MRPRSRVAMSLRLALLVVVIIANSSATVTWTPRIVTVPTVNENPCTNLLLGRKTSDQIILKERSVGSHDYLYIADYCSDQQKKLVGEDVIVCASAGAYPPSAGPVGAGRFSPLRVDCAAQNEPCTEIIYVNVTLYCETADHIQLNGLK